MKTSKSKRPDNLKSISRIDQETRNTHGWYVRVSFFGKTFTKLFSDKKCGGKDISLKAAITWRDEVESRIGKPRTDKPMIAAVILICVFILGISSAAFSETFIEAPLDVLSDTGLTGTVEFMIIDQSNKSLENASITIDEISGKTNANGRYSVENISLGINEVEIQITENNTLTIEILVTPLINSYNEIIVNEDNNKFIPYETTGCSIILLIFSVIALLGAVASLKRQHFDVAVAGALLGIFSFGFFMVGSILSLISMFIILHSKEEFENGKKGKSF